MADYGFDVKDFLYGAAIIRAIESQNGLDFSIRLNGQNENLLSISRTDQQGNTRQIGLLLKHARELKKQQSKGAYTQRFDFNLNANEQRGISALALPPADIIIGFVCADKLALGNGIIEYGRRGSNYKKDRFFFAFTTLDKLSNLLVNNKQGDCKLMVVRTAINAAHIHKQVRGGTPQQLALTVADFERAIF